MGGIGDYGTEKEVKKRYWQKWEKTNRRRQWHNKIIHQSKTKSVLSCRISVFATVKEAVGHFPVGLRLPSGLKNGSDVPGIFATIHPCSFVHSGLNFDKKIYDGTALRRFLSLTRDAKSLLVQTMWRGFYIFRFCHIFGHCVTSAEPDRPSRVTE